MKDRSPLPLSKTFNNLSRHPAKLFEINNHFRDISGRYRIPDGMTADAYEDLLAKQMNEVIPYSNPKKLPYLFWGMLFLKNPPSLLIESWNKLVRLNPILRNVRMDKTRADDVYNAHLGVTSGLNIDDINFYIEQTHKGEGEPAFQARSIPEHGERLARIEAVAIAPIYWVLSPRTAQRIEARFTRRKKLNLSAQDRHKAPPL